VEKLMEQRSGMEKPEPQEINVRI